ncbi:MAG TPA: hypothetical protein PLD84_08905, partial [Chitinophagales bacterium]|nr:hypothetical protein [Chitinophagales bacterium]
MKLFILLFMITLNFQHTNAQIIWEKTFGTSGWDESRDIALSNDGGYVLAGVGDYAEDICPHDYWIFKLDANGDSVWNKCYDLSIGYSAVAVNTCSDGGYIITGSYDTILYSQKSNIAILKIDSEGNEEWHRSFGGDSMDQAVDVVPTLDGGFIFVGTTWSYDGSIPNYHDQGDVWVIKMDSSGYLMWQQAYGGSGFDEGISIIETAPNKFLVVAHTQSQDGDILNPIGYNDVWVLQLDSSGNITWEESFGDSLDAELVNDAVLLNDGSIMLAGYSYLNDFGLNATDLFVMKLNSSGELKWVQYFGSAYFDYNGSLTVLSSGTIVLTGTVEAAGISGDVNCFHGTEYSDIWMVLLDTTGNMQDQRCLGGYQADYNDVLVEDASKNLVLAGTTL